MAKFTTKNISKRFFRQCRNATSAKKRCKCKFRCFKCVSFIDLVQDEMQLEEEDEQLEAESTERLFGGEQSNLI